jgi:hypothetical protein
VSGLDLKSAQRFCCIQLFVLAFWKLEEPCLYSMMNAKYCIFRPLNLHVLNL